MGLCLGNRGWPQKLSHRRLKQDQNRLYHRQLRGKVKSERQRGLLHRNNNGRKPAADLRTVVLNRKTVTTCRLFRSNERNNHPWRLQQRSHKQIQRQCKKGTQIVEATKKPFQHAAAIWIENQGNRLHQIQGTNQLKHPAKRKDRQRRPDWYLIAVRTIAGTTRDL